MTSAAVCVMKTWMYGSGRSSCELVMMSVCICRLYVSVSVSVWSVEERMCG